MKITQITNTANINFQKYKNQNVIGVLGSSQSSESIEKYMDMCSAAVKNAVLLNNCIITGCGSNGIMGKAYSSAIEYSHKTPEGKPAQNLAVIKEPLWGDEDLENCIIVDKANTEAQRLEKFEEYADSYLIFAGGCGTIQEAATLIANNRYGDKKQITLVGKEFFKGLDEQYKELKEAGFIKEDLSNLYTIADSLDEINEILGLKKVDIPKEGLLKTNLFLKGAKEMLEILNSSPDEKTTKYLLLDRSTNRRIPLHHAVDNLKTTKIIFDFADEETKKAMLMTKNIFGKNVLCYAKTGQIAQELFNNSKDKETSLDLIFSRDIDGRTPLFYSRSKEIAKIIMLEAQKFNSLNNLLDIKDHENETALERPLVKNALDEIKV